MLPALTLLLVCQLLGEVVIRALGAGTATQALLAPKSVTTPIVIDLNGPFTAALLPAIAHWLL
ncbi:hypothetical protein [Azonexus sp.]|uniref:hypothetical protein n=1 Tax=Azonexus sp. TaxID=1872668 RepID=UPI0039E44040